MKRLRDHLTCGSRLRYLAWRVAALRAPLVARLKTGERLLLRPPPSSDLATANEVFVGRAYHPPRAVPEDSVRHIVDLGANVGYSVVWWLKAFPHARITAYEPHPAHCQQIRWHLGANDGGNRVTLHDAAAGTADGMATLTDAENQSSVIDSSNGLTVTVRDLFTGLDRVDLLKIDIEGSEYDILADSRFGDLRPPVVVMEWHRTSDPRCGATWCEDRLKSLGYTVHHVTDGGTHGTLWGYLGG